MRINYLILGFLGFWLLLVSVFLAYIFLFFRRLSKDVGKGNLIKILENLIDLEKKNSGGLKDLTREVEAIKEDGVLHVQKVALLRFNPFGEIGGDYSFSLVLLDGKDTGIIMTGLHTRERTRIYVKDVIKGKSKVELSKEERKALAMAQKRK